jgi:hypothetical protein
MRVCVCVCVCVNERRGGGEAAFIVLSSRWKVKILIAEMQLRGK